MNSKNTSLDIQIIKNTLSGQNFRALMIQKKTNKYQIAKNTGISYRTLCKWQAGAKPSDESALLIGKYLGLIKPEIQELEEIKKQQKALDEKIQRLTNV